MILDASIVFFQEEISEEMGGSKCLVRGLVEERDKFNCYRSVRYDDRRPLFEVLQ